MAEVLDENSRAAKLVKARAAKKAALEAAAAEKAATAEVTETEEVKEVIEPRELIPGIIINQDGDVEISRLDGGKFVVKRNHKELKRGNEEKCRSFFDKLRERRRNF